MAKTNLTAQRVREVIHYDPNTGVFIWLKPNGRKLKAGMEAGYLDPLGYFHICIDRIRIKAHRLAWLYMTGEWPKNHIDHIDGNTSNNRFANLRDVDRFANMQNRRRPSKNNRSSGLMGAWPNKSRWMARIMTNRRLQYLGTFDTPEEAHAAYMAAKRAQHAI